MNKKKAIIKGDVHDGQAVRLECSGDLAYVSKPRNAKTEIAFKTFLENLEEKGFLYIPGKVEILSDFENRHYVKVVEHISVFSEIEVDLYYHRAGALLFFTYLFSSNDIHCDNIIAHGAYPTIIDFETFFTGETRSDLIYGQGSLITSVYASQLLPYWKRINGYDIDVGGFSGGLIDVHGMIADDKNENILYFRNHPTQIYDYCQEVIEGFSYAYDFAMEHEELFEEGIRLFEDCLFRTILRPTQIYLSIAQEVNKLPEEEREQVARKLLSIAYMKDEDPNRINKAKKILDAEINAVLNGEAPLFFCKGISTGLFNRKEELQSDFFINAPVQKAVAKLKSLSLKDEKSQQLIIQQVLSAARPLKCKKEKYPKLFTEMNIYQLLENNYIDGLASGWTYLARDNKDNIFFQSTGYGLYNGLVGILCCYAAIYTKTKSAEVLKSLYEHYEKYKKYAMPDVIRLDSFTASLNEGAGGHILSLAHISELTQDNQFIKDAQLIAKVIKIPEELPEGLDDVLGGYSGLAIALPYIDQEIALPLAAALLKRLLKYSPTLTGVGHGAAGVVLALCSIEKIIESAILSNTDNDHLFIEGLSFDSDLLTTIEVKVLDLLEWEDTYYDENLHNWLDLRKHGKKAHMLGWCSGAPGIGMARKMVLRMTKNTRIKDICLRDINYAKEAICGYGSIKRDNLCCGNSTRLMAASYLNIDADTLYKEVLKRLQTGETVLYHTAETDDFTPGLMQGYAGLGYAIAMYGDERAGKMLL